MIVPWEGEKGLVSTATKRTDGRRVNNDEKTASGHQICSSLMRSLRSWRRPHRLGQWAAFNGGRGQEVKSQRAPSCGEEKKNPQPRVVN